MVQLLMLEHDRSAAELTLQTLHTGGMAFTCTRVVSEAGFRRALTRGADLVIAAGDVPGLDALTALAMTQASYPKVPFIYLSTQVRARSRVNTLAQKASGWLPKDELHRLPSVIRNALASAHPPTRTGPRPKRFNMRVAPAQVLLERRALLERTLAARDPSSLSGLLSRNPPAAAALLLIDSPEVRERYCKLLQSAGIVIESATSTKEALRLLGARLHALLFTDQLDLIRRAEHLNCAYATHIMFVHPPGKRAAIEGLRAGANGLMPEKASGEWFCAQLDIARRILGYASSLQAAVSANRLLSTLDELTRVGNRHYFEHQWPQEVAHALRLHLPLALLVCDIDHFKRVNDRYGHLIGDQVLREFAGRLTHLLRRGEDWVARIGGEEFAIVLPETGRLQAWHAAERLREHIQEDLFSAGGRALSLTASVGVASLNAGYRRQARLDARLLASADRALYQSKRAGRNRVTVAFK